MKGTENKLSLEKYLDFVISHKQTDLKVGFLRQIINMHGFKRIEGPKSVVVDSVKAVDLMNPSRSTLRENISSAVSITLNDVMEDLKDLSWQECCVTSIKILNSHQDEAKEKHNSFSELQKSTVIAKFTKPIEDASAASTSSFAGVEIGQKSKKWVKKRKRNARGVANSTLA
ncbi:Regulator of rDNA transcription protein [Melia azedarach]|uniref:Regulator of rDNA transcription protein n=1 Tax=Melia azedarach TaxID=155640 RepID=A0ACC1Z2Y1_MELAZ|nr:Regulator of rDNA transcription protein [Melia azedarach]